MGVYCLVARCVVVLNAKTISMITVCHVFCLITAEND